MSFVKYRMRLCIKRLLDVEIEAKNQKEALSKGYELLKENLRAKGVNEKGATQVEWIETGNSAKSRFGELPAFR